MLDLGALIIIVLTAVVCFSLGHLITVKSMTGQPLFSRRQSTEYEEEDESQEQAIPPIRDEMWDHDQAENVNNQPKTPFEEQEMEQDYAREISS